MKADGKRVKAITSIEPPTNLKDRKGFFSMTSYRKFTRDYGRVTNPLTNLPWGELVRVEASQPRKIPIELESGISLLGLKNHSFLVCGMSLP